MLSACTFPGISELKVDAFSVVLMEWKGYTICLDSLEKEGLLLGNNCNRSSTSEERI